MCQCDPRMVVMCSNGYDIVQWIPHNKDIRLRAPAYWAYLHIDGHVKIKRWMTPASYEHDCDLCYAVKEQQDGNFFVKWILPWPFVVAKDWSSETIERIAKHLFRWMEMGQLPISDSIHRFEDLG